MKQIPLFGSGLQSYSAVVTSQRRLNCFYDVRPDGDPNQMIIRGTPGSALWITLPVVPIRGMYALGSTLYVVAQNILYSVTTSGTYTQLGVLATSSGQVSIVGDGLQLCVVDGTYGYGYVVATGMFARITDGNFPNTCATVTYLNGRFIVEKVGSRQAYASALYDVFSWSPLIFFSKENDPSALLAVEVVNGTLILYGATGIEFWQDVGTTPLPYQRVQGASQTWGLAAIFSRAPFNNTEIFLGRNLNGHVKVLMLNGYTPVPISTGDIEAIIDQFTDIASAIALTYTVDGHPMYQLTFPTSARSFLYDGATGLWSETQTDTELFGRHFAQLAVAFNGNNYASDAASGNIYLLDYNIYSDNGITIKRQIRTLHLRNGGNLFGISELYLDMETGVGLLTGQGSDPKMMIQVSKDGGRTFGVERQVAMGRLGQYQNPRLISRRWGMARDFVFQFTVTDPVKFVICAGSAVTYGTEGNDDAP